MSASTVKMELNGTLLHLPVNAQPPNLIKTKLLIFAHLAQKILIMIYQKKSVSAAQKDILLIQQN